MWNTHTHKPTSWLQNQVVVVHRKLEKNKDEWTFPPKHTASHVRLDRNVPLFQSWASWTEVSELILIGFHPRKKKNSGRWPPFVKHKFKDSLGRDTLRMFQNHHNLRNNVRCLDTHSSFSEHRNILTKRRNRRDETYPFHNFSARETSWGMKCPCAGPSCLLGKGSTLSDNLWCPCSWVCSAAGLVWRAWGSQCWGWLPGPTSGGAAGKVQTLRGGWDNQAYIW